MKTLLVLAAAMSSFAFAAQNLPASAAKTADTKVVAPTAVTPPAKVVHKKGIKRHAAAKPAVKTTVAPAVKTTAPTPPAVK